MSDPKNDRVGEGNEGAGTSRRAFLGGVAAAGAAVATTGCEGFPTIVPRHVLGGGPRFIPPSEKLNIGGIGAGGKGESDIEGCASENIVALCDVDEARSLKSRKNFPNAKFYHDYREMLDTEKLDAVIVSTPDHTHAPAGLMAMERGMHIYCQKPLTHDIWEAREMRKAAKKHGVVSQMGNQGTSEDGLRRAVELVQDGIIGDVTEVHVWTNRPVWPQGMDKPLAAQPIPDSMKWDLWLGTAPDRPYNKGYAPFNWRGWWDFGTGALGDMACHTANMPFMALKLGYADMVEAESDAINDQTFPKWSKIKFRFPAREGMPAVDFTWYDGGKKIPTEWLEGKEEANSGCMLIGSKGKIYSPNDYGAKFHILPDGTYDGNTAKPERLPSSPGHYKEWIDACKGQGKCLSDFDYAAKLTEAILLGNLALRVKGPMEWDGENMKSPSHPEAEQWVKRKYRSGY